jgi:hypothetical protein
VRVAAPDHAWFRSILEGYEGLVTWQADPHGVFELVAPSGREAELDDLLRDLVHEGSVEIV